MSELDVLDEFDWEQDFEDFDWSADAEFQIEEVGAESETTVEDELGDDELFELFSSFDDVRAGEDLRASTLEAIFAKDDEAEAKDMAEGVAKDVAEADVTRAESVAPQRELAQAKRARRGRRPVAARPRRARMVAFAACVLIAILGAASWFVPFSQVALAQDDLRVVLGVNLYGVTVSVDAQGDLSEEVVAKADLGNEGVADALDRLLSAYDKVRPDAAGTTPSVDVSSTLGFGGDALRQQTQQAIQKHVAEAKPADAPQGTNNAQGSQVAQGSVGGQGQQPDSGQGGVAPQDQGQQGQNQSQQGQGQGQGQNQGQQGQGQAQEQVQGQGGQDIGQGQATQAPEGAGDAGAVSVQEAEPQHVETSAPAQTSQQSQQQFDGGGAGGMTAAPTGGGDGGGPGGPGGM